MALRSYIVYNFISFHILSRYRIIGNLGYLEGALLQSRHTSVDKSTSRLAGLLMQQGSGSLGSFLLLLGSIFVNCRTT
jgi:hypothetical protein